MLVDGDPITMRNLMDDRSFVEFLHFVHYRQIVWMERNPEWALRDTKYSVVPSWLESKASKLLEWKLHIVTWIPRHDERGVFHSWVCWDAATQTTGKMIR